MTATWANARPLAPFTGREVARFWKAVDSKAPDECWLWTRSLSRGYGQFQLHRGGVWRPAKAHRVAFEMLVGPVPDHLQLDHLCRTPACVNPAHLEPVTNRENGLRGNSLPARNARKTHCQNGHELTPANTRRSGAHGRRCTVCVGGS